MNAHDELRLLAAGLYSGETRAGGICPFCRGGRTGEGSLSITQLPSGVALYNCHRAACGRAGRIGGTWTANDGLKDGSKSKEFEPRLYDPSNDVDPFDTRGDVDEQLQIERGTVLKWLGRFGLASEDATRRWNPGNQRTVWEVRSSLGTLRGFELRAYRDDHKPKTLYYRHTAEPWVGWFQPRWVRSGCRGGGGTEESTGAWRVVVAVEDCVSAYKVSMAGFSAASLMGTNLNMDRLLDLLSVSEHIVLALDRDATDKALGFARRYALLAPSLVVLPLQRDLKYEDVDTIKTMIGGVL